MFATIPSFLSAPPPPRQRAAPSPSPSPSFTPPASPTSFSCPSVFQPSMSMSPTSPSPLFASSSSSPLSSPPSLFSPSFVPTSFSTAHFPASSPMRHALVLSWEDVLAPTSLLAERVGLEPSAMAIENARVLLAQDTYLQQSLASTEEQTIALLTTAARLGPVVVVTDKSLAFMEATCAVFFPRLAIFLLQANLFTSFAHRVQVVAPPRHLSTPLEIAHWKSTLFQSVCVDQLQRDSLHAFSLINVTASHRDAPLCIGAAYRAAATLAVPKCVEVADVYSLETFFAQLKTLNRYLDVAAAHKTAFSTRL